MSVSTLNELVPLMYHHLHGLGSSDCFVKLLTCLCIPFTVEIAVFSYILDSVPQKKSTEHSQTQCF